ncbi:hypothetical protein ACTPEF_23455, partial [Clostridioides difficile]
ITTQFTMTTLEELGLLKMDFLGLRTLTVIRDTLDLIEKNRVIATTSKTKNTIPNTLSFLNLSLFLDFFLFFVERVLLAEVLLIG